MCFVFFLGHIKHFFQVFNSQGIMSIIADIDVISSTAQVAFHIIGILADKVVQQIEVLVGGIYAGCHIQIDQSLRFVFGKSFFYPDGVEGKVIDRESVDS